MFSFIPTVLESNWPIGRENWRHYPASRLSSADLAGLSHVWALANGRLVLVASAGQWGSPPPGLSFSSRLALTSSHDRGRVLNKRKHTRLIVAWAWNPFIIFHGFPLANANFKASPDSRKEGVMITTLWFSKLQGHTAVAMDEKEVSIWGHFCTLLCWG